MQANAKQKVQLLGVLYAYAAGQIRGAEMTLKAAEEDELDCEDIGGDVGDAADMLGVAQAFAAHNDMNKLLEDVNAHDTLVREDVYDGLRDSGCWDVLVTLEACYYK